MCKSYLWSIIRVIPMGIALVWAYPGASSHHDISHNQAFTANELKILRRYFFEDSVEDSSFALATTNSYTNKDVSSDLRKITINISSSKIERASSSSPMYSFTSGNISVGGNPNYVSAKIIRGTAEIDPSSKRITLSARNLWISGK